MLECDTCHEDREQQATIRGSQSCVAVLGVDGRVQTVIYKRTWENLSPSIVTREMVISVIISEE